MISRLQKYILRRGLEEKNRAVAKKTIVDFYEQKKRPKRTDQEGIIARSVERLIKRGLVKGYGVKTASKWFVQKIVLTSRGVKLAKVLSNRQQKLSFKIKTQNYGRGKKL